MTHTSWLRTADPPIITAMPTQNSPNQDRDNTGKNLMLDGRPFEWKTLDPVFEKPLSVSIAPQAIERVRRCRAEVEAILGSDAPHYGINTGFGSLCRTRIPEDRLEQLQENLVISHLVGTGPPMPDALVRWMMLFKLHAILAAHSGTSLPVVDGLQALLNADLLPIVPIQGSLGASGDLAPLSHMSAAMIGHGQVRRDGRLIDAATAMNEIGMKPVRLGAKDGLSLLNGTQFMSAYAAGIVVRARRLTRHADLIASMSLEGLRGSACPFDERLHALRPHPGAVTVARNFRALLTDSRIMESHAACDKVQDPYSLRCIPQVHGASRDALEHFAEITLREINSVTDNPLVFEGGETVSGGNFHGQPLALALDYAAIALAELGSISERRTYLLLSGHDELPVFLMRDTGVNSGFMMIQYTQAALASENKGLAHPASVDTIPTSLGQEDHVSMGATAATKCWRILDNVEHILAGELLCAAQALDFRDPLKPGVGPQAAHEELRKIITHAEKDRDFGQDVVACRDLMRGGSMLNALSAGDLPLE